MTKEDRQKLRDAAARAISGTPRGDRWELQTSNSFRRVGTSRGDGDVLCATNHPIDRHPDLTACAGVLDYIIAAQPAVVLELLDRVDQIEDVAKSAATDPIVYSELLRSMSDVVRKWRAEHGEIVAKELIRSYLTGLSDGCKLLQMAGAGAQYVLFGVLEGN